METEEADMAYEDQTLGVLLSDSRIRQIAPDAIRNRDLISEPLWNIPLGQLAKEAFFTGEIAGGIRRLYEAADTGDWYYPLYSDRECEENEARRGVNIVWFPSRLPNADERPFILLVPGGGFVNVWNLTEGWPIAEQFNRYGFHVFILTYQVDGEQELLERTWRTFPGRCGLSEKSRIIFM